VAISRHLADRDARERPVEQVGSRATAAGRHGCGVAGHPRELGGAHVTGQPTLGQQHHPVGEPFDVQQVVAGQQLDRQRPGAAASLREGLELTLTVTRLGVGGKLLQTLESTNPVWMLS
jgi:hypothetical protein